MAGSSKYRFTVVSFSIEIDIATSSVLERMLRKMTHDYQLLEIEKPIDETVYHDPVNPTAQTFSTVSSAQNRVMFDDAIKLFETSDSSHIFVFLQPSDPLERQTLGYKRLCKAMELARSQTLYFPGRPETNGEYILLVSHGVDGSVHNFASEIATQMGMYIKQTPRAKNIMDVQSSLLTGELLPRPHLIVWDQSENAVEASELTKLASVTRIPVIALGA